ncbi:coiled-coil domain-containing protein 14 isoform X2 [Boleophthalmus pectinirostris]|uniref:coiled-coil domain-containing protein 14 isoform X2 n=1 Tax=Boleophthalmus pectinirostris TaxID=150288 RepID=UPI00243304EF|nr:coiled-coil domain-containing protein 14 isoform X2 [Boleophthalmus pectinirostris]
MFAPRASVRSKVTSGRLTGASKVQAARSRGSPKSRVEPAYSLYSTDSEDQVATLHKGLDRCAALLSDILQCDNQDVVQKQDRSVKDAVLKIRPHTPAGKKAIRRSLSKSVPNPRSAQVIRRKSTNKPVLTTPQHSPAPPHSGVKLHPPMRKANLLKTPSKTAKPQPLRSPVPPAETHTGLDCVPERDWGPVGVGEGEEGKMTRVKCLLGELKTLMVGHGDSAQTYLHLLEQTVSSALSSENIKNQDPSTSQNQDPSTNKGQTDSTQVQLERQVKSLNQQLQDQEATQQLLNSQVLSLQGELSAAEKELSRVRTSLQETESRLQSREEESVSLKTELESTRGRLRATLQDKFKLEAMLQQKQQEIETLQRIIDSFDAMTPTPDNQPASPPGPAREHITQYLLSLQSSCQPQLPCPSGSHQGLNQGPEHDVDSVISDWSSQSDSSFNTRDEAVFRDGLAALDASIASLQQTLKMDLINT